MLHKPNVHVNNSLEHNPCVPSVECQTLQQLVTMYNNLGTDACEGSGLDEGDPNYCNDCFTWFINGQMAANYSYEQIQLMYLKVCDTPLEVCETTFSCGDLSDLASNFITQYTGDSLSCRGSFTSYFNEVYSTQFSFEQIMNIYKLYCGGEPALCGRIPITTCEQLQEVKERFLGLYETPLYSEANCQTAFTNYFNQFFGDTLVFNEIEQYYITLCEERLDICENVNWCERLGDYLAEFHAKYDTLSLPSQLCIDFFTQFVNQSIDKYNPAPGSNLSWAEISAMYFNCGIYLDVCNNSGSLCEKIDGTRKVFNVLFPNIINESNCGQAFTEFYNLYFNSSFPNYDSLENWVLLNCSFYLNVCGAPQGNDPEGGIDPESLPPVPTAPRLCETTTLFPTLLDEEKEPCDYIKTMALNAATEQYNIDVKLKKGNFDKSYEEKCLSAGALEIFTVTSQVAEYHYTLYYYDQAGNLVKTVPPAGVNADFSTTFHNQVEAARAQTALGNWQSVVPSHTLVTQYRYNSLGQVVQQKSPDGGLSKFWYDRLGRLALSQNAKQSSVNQYSYTLYDDLGRITEVGQISGTQVTQTLSQDPQQLASWLSTGSSTREQMTVTVYDQPRTELCTPGPSILCQQNLRNRVSYTYVQPTASFSNNNLPYRYATYYTYDIHGNVDVLLHHYNEGIMQEIAGNAFKKIEYSYDLVSGKVNKVSYQRGYTDQYYHRYAYDADNKLVDVHTSPDDVYWEKQASYAYYRHGPLARTELGQLGVQAIDYIYTLQGWLKGVNSSSVVPTSTGTSFDVGQDGIGTARTARDAYGFSLNYNTSDYSPINSNVLPFTAIGNGLPQINADGVNTGKDLFNGNIRAMLVNIPKLGDAKLYGYQYDQLNRITAMNAYDGLNIQNNSFTAAVTSDYKERISYDGNGNILSYLRNGTTQGGMQQTMDQLTYHYKTGKNQLDR